MIFDLALWAVLGLAIGFWVALLFARWTFRFLAKQFAHGVAEVLYEHETAAHDLDIEIEDKDDDQ